MQLFDFDFDYKVAVTENKGLIEIWSSQRWSTDDRTKVFQDGDGRKLVLYSDNGRGWAESKAVAPYCEYAQFWHGDFPYGSWCYAIRKCLVTGEVKVSTISTDINPRGESSSDSWKRRCATYVPDNVLATA